MQGFYDILFEGKRHKFFICAAGLMPRQLAA